MPTVAITLDLTCCRCKSKIQKILCSLQERCGFVFEKVVYEKDKVLISGPFDAIELCCKLRCKAGCFASKIEIVPPPQPPATTTTAAATTTTESTKIRTSKIKEPSEAKHEPEICKKLIPYPYPYPCPYPYPLPCPTNCPPAPRSCDPLPYCPSKSDCHPTPRPYGCRSCEPQPPKPCSPRRPRCPSPPQPPLDCRPPCKCPAWTPCRCPVYPLVICCDEKTHDPCQIM